MAEIIIISPILTSNKNNENNENNENNRLQWEMRDVDH